jgi:hypothetical protein
MPMPTCVSVDTWQRRPMIDALRAELAQARQIAADQEAEITRMRAEICGLKLTNRDVYVALEECKKKISDNKNSIAVKDVRISELTKSRDGWKDEWQMYTDAWIRELGGSVMTKTHLIDGLVLTTRNLLADYKKARQRIAELEAALGSLLHATAFYMRHEDDEDGKGMDALSKLSIAMQGVTSLVFSSEPPTEADNE